MWAVRAFFTVVLVICVVAFAYFNVNPSQLVAVNLVFVNLVDVPLITVVFWAFVAGMIVSLILFISIYFKMSVQLRAANRKIQAIESEVAVLRNRPIEESAGLLKGADEKHLNIKSPFADGE